MNQDMLKGKTAIITGCNRGIGKAILEQYAKNGANCVACVKTTNKEFEAYCKKLEIDNDIKVHVINMDLSTNLNILEGVKNIFKITKKIDILVNNAGILFNSLFQMTSETKLKEMFQLNFFSHVYITQLISREMVKNKKGNIIFISSTSAEGNDYGRFAYSSSKAAISSTTRVLSRELGANNIRVNSICPGLTETDLMKTNTKADVLDFEIKKISLRRIALPEEIASVALFLASDLSSYVNGQNLIVDGGR